MRSHLAVAALEAFAFSISLACLAPQDALAQSPPLLPSRLVEVVDPAERISGNAIVGAALIAATGRLAPDNIAVLLNAPVNGNLSLTVESVDGRYLIQAEYDGKAVAALPPGVVRLGLGQLTHANLLGRQDLSTAALSLVDGSGRRLVAGWGGATLSRDSRIRVYVNAERADAFFFVPTATGGRALTMCSPPPSSIPPFKFNRLCDVPIEAFDKGAIEIQRRVGSRRLDPLRLVMALPAPLKP